MDVYVDNSGTFFGGRGDDGWHLTGDGNWCGNGLRGWGCRRSIDMDVIVRSTEVVAVIV